MYVHLSRFGMMYRWFGVRLDDWWKLNDGTYGLEKVKARHKQTNKSNIPLEIIYKH